jgi:two-component system, NarL family, nitrate/nitrite response regulator NarL
MRQERQVVVVDDHPWYREAVVHGLMSEADLVVVGQGESADDAVKLAVDLQPDAIVLDLNMPGLGLNAARAISRVCPRVKIVTLTGSDDADDRTAALAAGAHAHLIKGCTTSEIAGVLRTVCAKRDESD